ncbi:hypothetical protein GNF10_31545 [Nostoc sp. UCD121]|uniref:hypothetical protein n=1 Tax=unclassified Nostoc TaxID=2593658 RepID=UPI0016251B26|nr:MULTISPECIES: hypothetical protein [unclassified Nostoc]MBC1224778.1 hypothetical protein [Nostoc sp. UCD120]MBC1280354.1 hypothetical protein [Nostoc sp. UCD121]MBC1297459.1 hypothetical protein [Nostoc sp. UCD122]
MIDDGDAKEIKRDYLDILEALLKNIQQKAKSKEIPTSNDISIYAGGKQVYKGLVGQSPSKNLLTSEQLENINLAITDPQNSQGTISIKIGKSEVFRVQNGRITNDLLGLAPPSQKNKVVSNERIYSVEALQKQVKVLQSKLQAQQKLVESIKETQQTPESLSKLIDQVAEMSKSLEKQQQLIENTQKALSQVNERFLPQVQNTVLQNWVGTVENKVKQTAKNVFERIKDVLTPEVTKVRKEITSLKSQINEQITSFRDEVKYQTDSVRNQLNQQVGNLTQEIRTQVDSVKNTVDQSLMGVKSAIDNTRTELRAAVDDVKGQAIEQSVKAMLNILGKDNPDGSKSFKSTNFDFERLGDNVIVRAKNGEAVLTDGVLSPNVSEKQLQALDKIQSVVDMHHQIQQDSQQESQFRNMHR